VFPSHTERVHEADDTKGFVLGARESDFRGHDLPVQAVFAFFAVTTVTIFSSDGSFLFNDLPPEGSHSRRTASSAGI